jgi:hypothetical protein
MKFFISFGLVLTLLWAFDVVICKSPSIVIWNTCFLIINSIHAIALIKKHFPTFLPSKLVTYYKTVFKPLKIPKKDFNMLIKGAKIETYIYGRHFCQGYQSKVWFWKKNTGPIIMNYTASYLFWTNGAKYIPNPPTAFP